MKKAFRNGTRSHHASRDDQRAGVLPRQASSKSEHRGATDRFSGWWSNDSLLATRKTKVYLLTQNNNCMLECVLTRNHKHKGY